MKMKSLLLDKIVTLFQLTILSSACAYLFDYSIYSNYFFFSNFHFWSWNEGKWSIPCNENEEKKWEGNISGKESVSTSWHISIKPKYLVFILGAGNSSVKHQNILFPTHFKTEKFTVWWGFPTRDICYQPFYIFVVSFSHLEHLPRNRKACWRCKSNPNITLWIQKQSVDCLVASLERLLSGGHQFFQTSQNVLSWPPTFSFVELPFTIYIDRVSILAWIISRTLQKLSLFKFFLFAHIQLETLWWYLKFPCHLVWTYFHRYLPLTNMFGVVSFWIYFFLFCCSFSDPRSGLCTSPWGFYARFLERNGHHCGHMCPHFFLPYYSVSIWDSIH